MNKALIVEGESDGEEVVEEYQAERFHHCYKVRKGADRLLHFLCFWLDHILQKTKFSRLLFFLPSHPCCSSQPCWVMYYRMKLTII